MLNATENSINCQKCRSQMFLNTGRYTAVLIDIDIKLSVRKKCKGYIPSVVAELPSCEEVPFHLAWFRSGLPKLDGICAGKMRLD